MPDLPGRPTPASLTTEPPAKHPHDLRIRILRGLLAVVAALIALAGPGAPALGAPGDEVGEVDEVGERFAQVDLESLSPTMVTSTSAADVTVDGEVINTSRRTLYDLAIRLERGPAIQTADELRSSLATAHPEVLAATEFTSLPVAELAPGAHVRFTLTVSLSGADGLAIATPGVYPLQLNVNGMPDYGGPAQLAGSRTLLPVLSLPPDRDRATSYVEPGDQGGSTATGLGADGSVSADLSRPSRFTLLWPLAAPPQLAPGVLGGHTEPVRLISEDLAASLQTTGRLGALLTSLQGLTTTAAEPPPAPTGPSGSAAPGAGESAGQPEPVAPAPSDLARSVCVAIDPDLLLTVRAMSLGYVVSTDPTDPTASTVPGTGQAVAETWLGSLREIAQSLCVVALPFAGADLSALAKLNSTGLTTTALEAPADIVDAILGIHSVRGVTIPALGALDGTTADLLRATHRQVVTAADNLTPARSASTTGQYRAADLDIATVDAPVTAALAALGTRPAAPVITPPDQLIDLSHESAVSRRQAAVGALAFAAISVPADPTDPLPNASAPATLPVTGRSQLILPSRYWSPTTEDADALLSTATVLLGAQAALPTSFTDLAGSLADARTEARITTPAGVGPVSGLSVPLPTQVAGTIRDQANLSWQLQGALVDSDDVVASPETYLAPLREDLLRALGTPDHRAARPRLAATRDTTVTAVSGTLSRMRSAVSILDPGGRYTLASERSPLLLVVRNDLSMPVRLRIRTDAPADLEIGDLGTLEIPARGTRQIQLPTHADSSEATTVTISLDTVTGVPLGAPIKLSVHSNAYGKVLFIITIVAAVALVLLTARRLWHRFRGQPDPADAHRPEPDELERLLAATPYQQRRRTLHSETAITETAITETGGRRAGSEPDIQAPTTKAGE
ncbi:MAG: DUF6049 family protein [Gordonia sp. (in: high G+C Gram-positive bacteria)]